MDPKTNNKQKVSIDPTTGDIGRNGSDDTLKMLFNSMKQGIVHQSLDGRIISANKAAENILGVKIDEMKDRTSEDPNWAAINEDGTILPGEEHPSMVALRTGDQVLDFVMGVHNPVKGERIWIEVDAIPIFKKGETDPHEVYTIFEDITDKTKLERDLKDREERYRGLFESARVAIMITRITPEGPKFEACNKKAAELFGVEEGKLCGMDPMEISPPNQPDGQGSASAIMKNMQKVMQGETVHIEWTHRRIDGTDFPCEVTLSAIHSDKGPLIQAIVRDITHRKSAEQAVMRSEEKYKHLVETIPEGISTTDLMGNMTSVNPANLEMMGYDNADELLGRSSLELIVEDQREKALRGFQETFEKGNIGPIRYDLIRKDGSTFPAELTASLVKDRVGNPVSFIAVTRDISLRNMAEIKLKEREGRLASIFKASSTGIGMVTNRIILEVNDRICEMLGREKDEILGKSALMLYPTKEEYERVGKVKYEQIERLGTGSVETQWIRKDGTVIDVLLSSTPIDKDDLQKGVTFTALDITENKKAKRELEESEARYRLLFETANETIIVAQDEMIRFVNPMGPKLLGYSVEELTSRPFLDFIHPEDREMVNERYQMRISGDTDIPRYPFRLLDIHGRIKWVEVEAVQIPWEGRPATLNFLSDVTERLAFEEALKESEEKYRELVENAKVIILKWNLSGSILFANEFAEEFFGYDQGELVGENMIGTIIPKIDSNSKSLSDVIQNTMNGPDGISNEEYENITKDGRRVWVNWTDKVIQDSSGEIQGMLSIGSDITEKKKQDAALREWDEIVRSFINQPLIGIVIVDEEGRILEWNDSMEEFLDISKEEALGKYIWDVQIMAFPAEMRTEERREGYKQQTLKALISGNPSFHESMEFMINSKEKGDRYFQSTMFSIKTEKGYKYCGLTIEITERFLSKQKIETEKNRAEFYLDLLSHDIGNIHQGLQSWTEIAKSSSFNEERRGMALSKIEELENRSLRLVKNVLMLSRLRDMEVKLIAIDVLPLLNKAIDDIKATFAEREIDISFPIPDGPVLVSAETVVEEVFFNLLHNGVKFQYDDPVKIEVSIETSDREHIIDIADHGIGIMNEQKDQLFDRHIRGSDYGYSGIGLSLVKELVETYGGRIEVRDRIEGEPGKGARFRVSLLPAEK